MKAQIFCIIIALAAWVGGGCATGTRTTTTALLVSGSPGTHYTAHYRAGGLSGEISSVVSAGGAAKVLRFDTPDRDFTCSVEKAEQSADLTAEIVRGEKTVFRAEAPPGTMGVRITHTANGWRQETF